LQARYLVDYDPSTADVFDKLPVMQIRNWSEVTSSFLEDQWASIQTRSYSWERMYLPFWLDAFLTTATGTQDYTQDYTS